MQNLTNRLNFTNHKMNIMSDDLNKKGFQDRSRINMNEDHEVAYWTEKFGVTKEELQKAIDRTGTNSADEIEKALDLL